MTSLIHVEMCSVMSELPLAQTTALSVTSLCKGCVNESSFRPILPSLSTKRLQCLCGRKNEHSKLGVHFRHWLLLLSRAYQHDAGARGKTLVLWATRARDVLRVLRGDRVCEVESLRRRG